MNKIHILYILWDYIVLDVFIVLTVKHLSEILNNTCHAAMVK